jgi:predicted nuclease of predicted toxin-antitoxin system
MNLLANENFPRSAVEALRAAGHDVVWARTNMTGATDAEVLARAQADGRVLLSFDKDFGELAFRSGLPATCGVVLFRFAPVSPEFVAERVVTILAGTTPWVGHFAVVEETRIRLRPLP